MLLKISEILYENHTEEFNRCLDLRGRTRPYFSKNKHVLRMPTKIDNTEYYVETNLNANQIVKISYDLIGLFDDYKESDLQIFTV